MKRTYLIIICCIVSQVAVAQCRVTMTLSINGCTGDLDGRVAERTAEALFNHYVEQAGIGFSTLQECNTFRNIVISELDMSYGTCRIRVNVSPCMGCSGSLSNSANIIAIGQGQSFYSTNSANEIRNWSEDDIERMIALNKEYVPYYDMSGINTGDTDFDKARYELTGNMPEGSTRFIKKDDNQIVSISPPSKGTGVVIPNEYFDGKIFNSGGGGSSNDLNMSNAFAEMQKREEERKRRELEWELKEAEIWDEIRTKLDDENFHLLAYFFKTYNGDERPQFLGITESGRYVFESIDGNRVFSVSNDANDLQAATFEEHSWDDENIIKAIQEKSFKEIIDDRFEFKFKGGELDVLGIEDGKISFKDLGNLSPDNLRKLLPQLKAELKLKLFDNSSTITYEYMHLFNSHISLGAKAIVKDGGNDNIGISLSVTGEGEKKELFSDGRDYYEGSTSTANKGLSLGPIKIKGGAKAEIELASMVAKGTAGYVKKAYGNYFYCSGGAELKGGARIDKNIIKRGWKGLFYLNGNVGNFQCKNITSSTDNFPTQKR